MKANELMIGDWVYRKGKCHKVTSIMDGYISTDEYSDSHDYYFEPIPLTEEILKANGFEAKHGFFIYNDENDFYLVTWNEISHHLRLRTFDNDCSFDKDHIDYVHELQHALRPCGLNELADNLKVE